MYISPLSRASASLPFHTLSHHRALGWAPCVTQVLSAYCLFTHGSVYMSMVLSQFVLPFPSPAVSTVHTSHLCWWAKACGWWHPGPSSPQGSCLPTSTVSVTHEISAWKTPGLAYPNFFLHANNKLLTTKFWGGSLCGNRKLIICISLTRIIILLVSFRSGFLVTL